MASRLRSFDCALLLSATAAIACALVPSASGATIAVTGETAVFRAAPGEANDLQIGIWAADPCSNLVSVTSLCASDVGAPLTARLGCEQLGPNLAGCPEDDPDPRFGRPMEVIGGDGDDTVWEESWLREVTLRGGSGNDALRSGSGAGKSPLLYGGPGGDTLYVYNNGSGIPVMRGGLGDDELCSCEFGGGLLYGEGGDDRLIIHSFTSTSAQSLDGGPGNDVYVAERSQVDLAGVAPGPGIDTLDGSMLPGATSIDLSGCSGCVERVIGSRWDDQIAGDANRQVILGGAGLDVIRGFAGSDVLAGQDGDDTIYSRDNSVDIVNCGPGGDTVRADRTDVVAPNCENVRRAPRAV